MFTGWGLDDAKVSAEASQPSEFMTDVIAGLRQQPKTIPCKYFYDAEGSRLFEQICETEAYYPTRTELSILHKHLPEITAAMGPQVAVIEPGSGNSKKTRLLLAQLQRPVGYVPVDISQEHLLQAADALQTEFPQIPILPVTADYTKPFSLPSFPSTPRRVFAFYPGSTIGNFTPPEAILFLARWRSIVGQDGGLLIGVDRKKSKAVLELAYNDPEGLTALFHFNLLSRINRELGADFVIDGFRHHALYNEDQGRIEMYLVSRKEQTVHIGGHTFWFARGESICTEYSYKYTPEEFERVALEAGFGLQQMWTDPREYFSIYLFSVFALQP